jgi:methyl-accepting chemotaxis protein
MFSVILAPAKIVLNQLNYRLKFTLIGVILALPLLTAVFMLYSKNQAEIDFSKKEQDGAMLCQVFLETMNDVYQHKSYTEAIRMGNTDFVPTLRERQAEIDGDFKDDFLKTKKHLLTQYKLLPQTEKVFKTWTELKTNWQSYDEAKNKEVHDKLLAEFNQLYLLTANNTNLILDPEVASYNFADVLVNKAPGTYAKVSEIRDLGIRALSVGITEAEGLNRRDLLDTQLDESLAQIDSSLNVIYETHPEFKAKLTPVLKQVEANTIKYSHQYLSFNQEGQINPEKIDYFNQGDKLLGEFQIILDQSQKNLDDLLKKRIQSLETANALFIVISVISLCLLAYLFFAFYDVVIQAVSRIEDTTLRLAEGDLTVHVDVESKDEIGRIGHAFNTMAQRFLDLIRDVQSSTGQVTSSSKTLTDTSSEMTETAQEMAAMASQASGLTEELNLNISTVAAAVEQSSASIRQVTEACNLTETNIKRIGEVAQDISGRMQTVSGATQNVQASVNAVAHATDSVSVSVNTVSAAMYQITSNANELAKVSEVFDHSLHSAAKDSTNMTNAIGSVAEAMSDITSSVNTVASAVEEMTASLTEVARNTNTASSISEKAQKAVSTAETVITTLDSYAKEIGNVVEVIKTIAEQTDLLALNATIEAARAGEAGKGFAVVANEVKELAKQASSSTEVIRGQVQMIQNSTNSTIGTIKEISAVITELNQINSTIAYAVEEQTHAADQIRCSAENSAQAVTGVSQNVQQVATSASSVNNVIHKLSGDSKQVAESVQGIAQAASDVNQNIQEIVTSTQEVGQNVQTIQSEMTTVAEHIQDVTQTAIDIARQVGQASDNVQHITRNMKEIDTGTNEIAKTSSSVAQNASEMAKSVQMVETSTQKTFEGSNYTKNSAGQLLDLASHLETVVSQFKTEAVSLN